VKELLNAMNEFVSLRQEEGSSAVSLSDFLMEVSLMTDQDNVKDENAEKVTLMTVHSAKGLEFKNVFIAGMENDLFPVQQSSGNMKSIEEERRLFYVAITRAKENCIITYATNRFRNGQSNPASPSFFLKDIDRKYLDFPSGIELPGQRWRKSSSLDDDVQYDDIQRNKTYVKNQPWDWDGGYKGRRTSGLSNSGKQGRMIPLRSTTQGTQTPTANHSEYTESLAGLKVGNKVVHERFGEGIVLALEGKGGDARATVSFVNAGTKFLVLKYAKLKIIES